jgi:hypothetical protein
MIPEIAMFWVISTALVLQGVTIAARGPTKKPLTRIFNFMRVGKSQFSLEISSAEISPRVCTAKLRCFGFQRNGSLLCSLCCIAVQI